MLQKTGIRIIKKLGLLEKLNLEGSIHLNGKKIRIPVIHKMGYSNLFINELWMTHILKMLPEKEGVFIDVGANVGQTLLKFKSVFPNGAYIGFEPNPACIFYLHQLVKSNQLENIKLIPSGLADFDGIKMLNFYDDAITGSSASVIEDFRPGMPIDRQETIMLSRFQTIEKKLNINAIRAIKIDVEGYELEVLKSLMHTIETFRPPILMEILPVYNKTENQIRFDRQIEIEQLFKKLHYSLFRIIKKDDKFQDLKGVRSIGVHSDMNLCEYLVLANEKIELITIKAS